MESLPPELVIEIALESGATGYLSLALTCRYFHACLRNQYTIDRARKKYRAEGFLHLSPLLLSGGSMFRCWNLPSLHTPMGIYDGARYQFYGKKLQSVSEYTDGFRDGWQLFVHHHPPTHPLVYTAVHWEMGQRSGPQYDFSTTGLIARKWWKDNKPAGTAYYFDPIRRALRHAVTHTPGRSRSQTSSEWKWKTGEPNPSKQNCNPADVQGAFCQCGLFSTGMEPRAGPACRECVEFWECPILQSCSFRSAEPLPQAPNFLRFGVVRHGIPAHWRWNTGPNHCKRRCIAADPPAADPPEPDIQSSSASNAGE